MLKTKSYLDGNSVMVELPKVNGQQPPVDQEYKVIYFEDGSIVLQPKLKDPFKDLHDGEYYEADEWEEINPLGNELL
ncbi:type II toxin-antitoxin system PemI/MazE family antitoxin [Xylocopilactobacillus apis]|uniref:AbrB family transcriptional regulator n=1 Tax=Xylocopilactobacillus apis TaxID=2932183 RepID=A0AAU9DQG2_9LACO|nr:AbrB family transcriptional regulator [Xylocopilactobacillus apis]BDR57353.1 hypothetical protein KIMC2_19150 [Xylocopilactobacillus apis]